MPQKKPKKEKPADLISVAFLVTREFYTAEKFSVYVEQEAERREMPCMDVLLEYCETKDIEPEAVAAFITDGLKNRIQDEANSLHLLKK